MKTWKHCTFIICLAIAAFIFVFAACDNGGSGVNDNGTESGGGSGGGSGGSGGGSGGGGNISPNPAFYGTWKEILSSSGRINSYTIIISANEIYFENKIIETGEITHSYTMSNFFHLDGIVTINTDSHLNIHGKITQSYGYDKDWAGEGFTFYAYLVQDGQILSHNSNIYKR